MTYLVSSRFTSSAESRYEPIEGDALAVVDALEKARHFLLGCPNLMIAVDHKLLLKVFGDRSLDHSYLMTIRTQPENSTLNNSEEDFLGGIGSITWNDVHVATDSDSSMINLINLIKNRFPQA